MDSKQSRANKRKGSDFERSILEWCRSRGLAASRLARRGRSDEGDIAIDLGDYAIVIEAKNTKALALSQWITESETEAQSYAKARGMDPSRVIPAVVVKRRMKGVDQSYAVVTLETFTRLFGI